MAECPYCNAKNLDGSRFCSQCGKEVSESNQEPDKPNFRFCVACGRSVNWSAKACPNCGFNLKKGIRNAKIGGVIWRSHLTSGVLLFVAGIIVLIPSIFIMIDIANYPSHHRYYSQDLLDLWATITTSIAVASALSIFGGISSFFRTSYIISIIGGFSSLYGIGYLFVKFAPNVDIGVNSYNLGIFMGTISFFIGLAGLIVVINLRDQFLEFKKEKWLRIFKLSTIKKETRTAPQNVSEEEKK